MYIPLTFEGALQKCLFASSSANEGFFISGSQQWKYHWFTGSSTLTVQKGTIDNVQIFVIGGGGSGANGTAFLGGGGGGGGAVTYTMNGRLFAGTYNVSVGRGGLSPVASNTPGNNGTTSSFIGANINMIAGGGGGGGTVLNVALGGAAGGPGGGAGGSGGTNSCANGNLGTLIYVAGQGFAGFGCGGAGSKDAFSGGGCLSCNDTSYGAEAGDGANRYGMGGGGANGPGYGLGGDGGSGSVLIQYPIFDYCSNYFNETGSCGCRQITLDTTDPLNYYPDLTGSYIYMPCGGDRFVSGSLSAYAPLTVCAVSNSYYSYTKINAVTSQVSVNSGFASSGIQCTSQSLIPVNCSSESFAPTCTSSIVTVFAPTGSIVESAFSYVEKNATTHSVYNFSYKGVKYFCISTGSIYGNGIQPYPKITSDNGSGGSAYTYLYNTASCNTVLFNGTGRARVYDCNGAERIIINPSNQTYCIDTTIGVNTVPGFGLPATITFFGDCISGSFNTGSCGCP